MTKTIRKPWFLTLVFTVFPIVFYFAMLLINAIWYLGAVDLSWLIYFCLFPAICAQAIIRRIDYDEEFTPFRVIALFVLLIIPLTGSAISMTHLPAYTLKQAADRIKETSTFQDVRSERRAISFTPEEDSSIRSGYLFQATQNSEEVEIVFHPGSGNFHVLVPCRFCDR